MKFKRFINIEMTHGQSLTIPDNEFWKVSTGSNGCLLGYKMNSSGAQLSMAKFNKPNAYELQNAPLAGGATLYANLDTSSAGGTRFVFITGIAFAAD